MADELRKLEYNGGVVFCGYGEPLLHPQLDQILRCFKGIHTEIVTNGDRLTPKRALELFDAGLSFLCVSMYDGQHQIEHFEVMMRKQECQTEEYILRDRWHNEEDQFNLKLTNRSGSWLVQIQRNLNSIRVSIRRIPWLLIGMVMSYSVSKIGIKK